MSSHDGRAADDAVLPLPTISDIIFVEGLTGDLYLEDPHDVEVYNTTFRTLVQLAASPDITQEIIAAMIARYSAQLR